MSVFRGSGTGTINSTAKNIPATISSFSIVNTSGGNITVTVYVGDITISAVAYTLKTGQAYIRDTNIRMEAGDVISIISTGVVEYYFTIE